MTRLRTTRKPHPDDPIVLDTEYNWYVARSVAGNLNQLVVEFNKFEHPNIKKIFIPVMFQYQHPDWICEMMFPGYFLIYGVLDGRDVSSIEFFFPRCHVLRQESEPAVLSTKEVRHIERLCNKVHIQIAKFKRYETVRVTDGAFTGMMGKVEKQDPATHQAVVKMAMFGKTQMLKFHQHQLEKA